MKINEFKFAFWGNLPRGFGDCILCKPKFAVGKLSRQLDYYPKARNGSYVGFVPDFVASAKKNKLHSSKAATKIEYQLICVHRNY